MGIGAGDGGVTTLELDTWNRIYDTNVTGMFLTCKHAIPAMRAGGGGAIVNISSVAAIASAGIAAYKTSKAAVNALTQHSGGRQLQTQHPCQRDHAGPDGHPNGGRRLCPCPGR